MFRFLVACGLAVSLLALSVRTSALEVKLAIADDGSADVIRDGQVVWSMHPGIFAPGWKMIRESKVEPGYPKKEGGTTIFRFAIAPPGEEGVVNVTLTVIVDKDSADFEYVFEVPKALKLNNIFVRTRFPVAPSEGKTLQIGDKEVKLPAGEYEKGKSNLFTGNVERVIYPVPDVPIELKMEPNTQGVALDLREWGTNDFEVRINLLPPTEGQEVAAGTKLEKGVILRVPGLTSISMGKD